MDLTLASLFTSPGYSITWRFNNIDLINGGPHRATDVGNFGMNDPIKAPADLPARGLYHFDTAIGCEYALGDGWTLALWHLNATLSPVQMVPGQSAAGPWQNVVRGQVCGRTGNSGALVNGNPMPAHTHIRLEHDGIPFDVEPFLLGQPFGEDDMNLPPSLEPMAAGTFPANLAIRSSPQVPANPEANVLERLAADTRLGILFPLAGQGGYLGPDNTVRRDWFATGIGPGSGVLAYVAAAYGSNVMLTDAGRRYVTQASGGFTQAQVDAARLQGFTVAKSKARVSVEAIQP